MPFPLECHHRLERISCHPEEGVQRKKKDIQINVAFKNTVIQLVTIISSFSFLDNLETVVKHLKVEHNHLIQILLGAIVIKMSIIDP